MQILLPLYGRDRKRFSRELFELVAEELLKRFDGMTAYANAPARGVWQDDDGRAEHDEIIVLEIMTESLDRNWWQGYRETLESRFAQDEFVIRALDMQRL